MEITQTKISATQSHSWPAWHSNFRNYLKTYSFWKALPIKVFERSLLNHIVPLIVTSVRTWYNSPHSAHMHRLALYHTSKLIARTPGVMVFAKSTYLYDIILTSVYLCVRYLNQTFRRLNHLSVLQLLCIRLPKLLTRIVRENSASLLNPETQIRDL